MASPNTYKSFVCVECLNEEHKRYRSCFHQKSRHSLVPHRINVMDVHIRHSNTGFQNHYLK